MSLFGFMTLEGATIIVLVMCFLDLIKYILCIPFNGTTACAPETKYETIDSPALTNFEEIICPAEPICPTKYICPAEPICPAESKYPTEPIGPAGTIYPTEPICPAESKYPTEPIGPTGTIYPTETIGPAGTIYPTEPIGPAGIICPSEPICPPEPMYLLEPECPPDPNRPPEFKGPMETTSEITTLIQDCLPEPKSEGTKHPVEANSETIKDASELNGEVKDITQSPQPKSEEHKTESPTTLIQDCLTEPKSEGTKHPVEANSETIKDASELNGEVKDITQSPQPKTEEHKIEGPSIELTFAPEAYSASDAAWEITMLAPEGLSKQKSEGTKHPAETNWETIEVEDAPESNGEVMNLPQLKQPTMEVTVDSIIPTCAPKPTCA